MARISLYKLQLIRVGCLVVKEKAIKSPKDAWDICEAFLRSQYGGELPDREHFGALWLNSKNCATGMEIISIGSLNAAIVIPRECFKGALEHNAASMIVFHNHPSGDPQPSPEDIAVTSRLVDAGMILGVELLDHIILGEERFVSLKDLGYI